MAKELMDAKSELKKDIGEAKVELNISTHKNARNWKKDEGVEKSRWKNGVDDAIQKYRDPFML